MTAESTNRDYDRLCGLLKAVSLRHQLRACLEFLILLASGVLLLLLGSLTLPGLAARSSYLPLAYWAGSIVFLACLFWRGLRAVWPGPSLQQAARGLERRFPGLRDDVTNSILLFGQTKSEEPAGRPSLALIRAQLKKSVEKVGAIKPSEVVSIKKGLRRLVFLVPLALTMGLVLVIDSPMVGRALALLSHPLSTIPTTHVTISLGQRSPMAVARGTSVVLRFTANSAVPEKLVLFVWPDGGDAARFRLDREAGNTFAYRTESARISFRYQAATERGDASPVGAVRVVDPPDLARLRLTLTPPPYAHLPTHTQDDGHITALNGTLVNLDVTPTKEVLEGEIILNGQNRYPLTVDGPRLAGSLLVLQPGTYSIRLKDALGFENSEPVKYEIRVVPDRSPEAEITEPAADMEINGDETIPVTYIARDDFGLASVRLVYQVRGEERQIGLKNGVDRRSLGPETFKWDLSGLALLPGERVAFRIEAEDNDAISGPKRGFSRSIVLSVKDERVRASREEADSRRLADALLELLADQLEEKKQPEALTKGMDDILDQIDKDLKKMGDRAERFHLEALRHNLESLKERTAREPKEKTTQELERLALLAEDIAKEARMNEVEAMTREMRNRQRQLLDAFREFKGPPNLHGLEKFTTELKKLEELLRSIMDALGKLATRLPDEFVNSQELSGLEFQDMFGDLAEMYKKLQEGDMAGALEAARRMLQNLQEMMASLGRAGTRAGMSPFDRLQAEMSRQAGELDKILAEQKEIFSDTEQMRPGDAPDAVEREKFPGLSGRQGRLRERTDTFLERLEALAQLFPGMDTDVLKDIEGAAGSMGEATVRLDKEDAEGALPPEEEAIRRLSKSQQAMQQMSQQMAQQAGARMQANRWGYMLAYDPRPGWYYGPWMPMPTLPQPEVKFPRERGQTGIDREEFEPPSKDAYRVPRRFRERIMESMKERVPQGYEKDVEHYFRGLAE